MNGAYSVCRQIKHDLTADDISPAYVAVIASNVINKRGMCNGGCTAYRESAMRYEFKKRRGRDKERSYVSGQERNKHEKNIENRPNAIAIACACL